MKINNLGLGAKHLGLRPQLLRNPSSASRPPQECSPVGAPCRSFRGKRAEKGMALCCGHVFPAGAVSGCDAVAEESPGPARSGWGTPRRGIRGTPAMSSTTRSTTSSPSFLGYVRAGTTPVVFFPHQTRAVEPVSGDRGPRGRFCEHRSVVSTPPHHGRWLL